jgi:hypothetical protein
LRCKIVRWIAVPEIEDFPMPKPFAIRISAAIVAVCAGCSDGQPPQELTEEDRARQAETIETAVELGVDAANYGLDNLWQDPIDIHMGGGTM